MATPYQISLFRLDDELFEYVMTISICPFHRKDTVDEALCHFSYQKVHKETHYDVINYRVCNRKKSKYFGGCRGLDHMVVRSTYVISAWRFHQKIEYRFAVKAIMLKYTAVSSVLNTEIFNELRFYMFCVGTTYKMLSVTIWKVTTRSYLHTNKSFFKHIISVNHWINTKRI